MITLKDAIAVMEKKIPPEDRINWIILLSGILNDLRHAVGKTKAKSEVSKLTIAKDEYLLQVLFCEMLYNEAHDGNDEPIQGVFPKQPAKNFINIEKDTLLSLLKRAAKCASGPDLGC